MRSHPGLVYTNNLRCNNLRRRNLRRTNLRRNNRPWRQLYMFSSDLSLMNTCGQLSRHAKARACELVYLYIAETYWQYAYMVPRFRSEIRIFQR